MKKYSDECLFCVKYAKEHGIISSNFEEVARLAMELDVDFNMVEIKKHPKVKKTTKELRREFFEDVAKDLRLLWPAGNKEGKWPWRCDKLSLASRLMTLWEDRHLSYDITKEEILNVAKEYVSKFKDDDKFMKICKYFVYKYNAEERNGTNKALVTCQSPLADALEAHNDTRQLETEWDNLFNEASVGQGELV